MLQRIQSVYFLLASLALYALFYFPLVHNIYTFDYQPVTIMINGIYQDINGQMLHTQVFTGLTIAAGVVGAIPLALIFLYKNRKQQLLLSYVNMLVIFAFTFWMAQQVKQIMGTKQIDTKNVGIGVFLSTISLVFIVLAIKAIQRDEKLVKSADRLR